MDRLSVSFEPDSSDGVGLLRFAVETRDFAGAGGFWAQSSDIDAFAAALTVYPISTDKPPSVRLGYERHAGDDLIVAITIKPDDLRGTLRVVAELADYLEPTKRVRTSFVTHYPELERFRHALVRLSKGEVDGAILEGS
jgi:hypothetical protein